MSMIHAQNITYFRLFYLFQSHHEPTTHIHIFIFIQFPSFVLSILVPPPTHPYQSLSRSRIPLDRCNLRVEETMQFYHNFIRTRDQSARVVARDSCKRPRVRRAFNNKQLAPRFVLTSVVATDPVLISF